MATHITEQCSLQEKMRADYNAIVMLMESDVMLDAEPIREETREYVIEAAMKRYVKQGKTPLEARAIIESALNAPFPYDLPSFDDL